jgi:two-component system, response regulator FlrC
MIPVVLGDDISEAKRVHAGLVAAGLPAQLVEDLATSRATHDDVALVHVSRLSQAPTSLMLSDFIAFGGADDAASAVRCMQRGAVEYWPAGSSVEAMARLLKNRPQRVNPTHSAVAVSGAMCRLVDLAQRVAQADISVLIAGESGTGKEVIAKYIHAMSKRADGPFVAVNCAAIPETMLEAVLFGHEKGAFTGASEKRLGKFELADSGTLLLDEITEMPVALQAKLLRVLQEREVERIGSNRPRKIDVRVLATSNRDLQDAVAHGHLREDLYYRLSVFPLILPPLRERSEDIVPLAHHFLAQYGASKELSLSQQAEQTLNQYHWPGNVRELENAIQRALVLCDQTVIYPQDLGLDLSPAYREEGADSLQAQMRNQEEQLLLRTLEDNGGVRKTTAAQLGISERTLRYKLKQLKDRGILN